MQRDQFVQLLINNNISMKLVSFDKSSSDDCFVVHHILNGWIVYYQERGKKYDEKLFATESELYDYLANRIIESKKIGMKSAKTWSDLTQRQKDVFISLGITTADGKLIQ